MKDTLSSSSHPVEVTREGNIVQTPTHLDEKAPAISAKVKKKVYKKK